MDGCIQIFSGQQEQPDHTSATDKQRYAEQVALLYRNAPFAYVMTLACAVLLSWVQRTLISTDTLRVWLLSMLLLTIARSVIVYCYFRTRPDLDDAPRWGHYYLLATALSGMLWGSAALFLFPTESTTHQVVVAMVLAGMSAGAVPMLSSILEVFWVFMLPALLPLAIRLFAAGNELTTILGVITVILIAGMLISARRMNRSIIDSLSLGFENRALFVQLERDKAETDHLNMVLHAQIAERNRVEQLAFYDTLTGLANRRLFQDRLEQALRTLQREHQPLALLHLDVDHFKRINDTLGHDAGDLLLQTVAQRLVACVRQQDTVARLGGDEFIVILKGVNSPTDAGQVARKMLNSLREPIRLPTQEVVVTISLGITVSPEDGVEATQLMKHVDLALYGAKQHGRNTYRFFIEEMNQQASRCLQLEKELRVALQQGQFSLQYQPLVHLPDQRVVGLEALVRWDHPQRGILHPDQFISVAEQTGLIVPLGEWILSQVCQDQLRIRDVKPDLGRVMVNLSPRQFHDPKLLQSLPRLFTEMGCAAGWLGLEITEHLLMTETKNTIKVLARLRDLGISISIDDFGKGLASLNCLNRLPIDSIKIDHSLVRDMAMNTNSQAISATLIDLGHKLGLQVAAEGIETADQLAFLQENHCHYGQGHLFGRPVFLCDMLDLLRDDLMVPIKQCEQACR